MISDQNGRLKREKWQEWFRTEIGDGYAIRFYFPTEKIYGKGSAILWVWYLVPFVLFVRLFSVMIKAVYMDTRQMLSEWKDYRGDIDHPLKASFDEFATTQYCDTFSDGVGLQSIEHPRIKGKSILSRFLFYFVRPKFSEESLENVNRCNCYKALGLPKEKTHVHLVGCEEHEYTKEYDKLVWWKKLFTNNPRNSLKA